jgi:hypothetical protein
LFVPVVIYPFYDLPCFELDNVDLEIEVGDLLKTLI